MLNQARKNIRLQNWDYSLEGSYFITICCNDKLCHLGNITNKKIVLSPIGKIAHQYWLEIPKHFPHVKLDEFVIMPNHIHGILILDYTIIKNTNSAVLQKREKEFRTNQFANPIKNSVSTIINQYKSSVKRWCNKNGFNQFTWQSRFYDEIIHNEKILFEIREYIYKNPIMWEEDKENQQRD
jgi:putative transposase